MTFAALKDFIQQGQQGLRDWEQRAAKALAGVQSGIEGARRHAAVVAMLVQAHDQAAAALAAGADAQRGGAPWELAHGLSVLGLLGGRQALPMSPEQCPTSVLKDGSLLGCRKWELLDPGWAEALVKWLEYLDAPAQFGRTPALLTMPDKVVLALAGDWGTGTDVADGPAAKVARAIKAVKPHYTVHLGDVYYAGTDSEEDANMRDWPQGSNGSFSLNSNHELYSGAHGYFAALRKRFPLQCGTSYFALQNTDWLVVGLDSSFYADKFNLYMQGQLGSEQTAWLAKLPKNKRIIVLSHHEGDDEQGRQASSLYDQVRQALGRNPDYWYWGHLHNGIVYKKRAGCNGRCIGHGAIPYGQARELDDDSQVLWYEKTLAGDASYPLRVLNGFAKVTLDGANLSEQLIGEDGSVRWAS